MVSIKVTSTLMMFREAITLDPQNHIKQKINFVGKMQNCLMLSVVEHIGTTHTLKGDITAFLELEVCSGKGWGIEFRPKHLVLCKKKFNISNCSV